MKIGEDMLGLFPQWAGSCTQRYARDSRELSARIRRPARREHHQKQILLCRVSVEKPSQYTPPPPQH